MLARALRVSKCLLTTGRLRPESPESIIGRLLGPKVRYMQIGAHEGREGDPVRSLAISRPLWSGILVEPVPALFDKLSKEYPNKERHRFENVAISPSGSTRSFYSLNIPATRPDKQWASQLGSFDRGHILKHGEDLEAFIEPIDVRCEALMTLIVRCDALALDLLVIDAEGFDWEVLRELDLTRCKPKVIFYEHKHLSDSDALSASCKLTRAGYTIRRLAHDTVAYSD